MPNNPVNDKYRCKLPLCLTRIAQSFEKVFDISLEERNRIYIDIKGEKPGKRNFWTN